MYLLPKMLGSRDLAFPRLSSLGWWCYLFGGTIIVIAMLAGVAPDAGWFLYPPLSGKTYTPASTPMSGCSASPLSRFRRCARDRDYRVDPEAARGGHAARPHADLRLVSAGDRRDDGVRLSAADPGVDPAGGGARFRLALLLARARWIAAFMAASVLAVRPSRGLHHLPAGGRRGLHHFAGDGAHPAARPRGHRRGDPGARFPQLRAVGTPYVHHRHSAYGARLLLGGVRAGGDPTAVQCSLGSVPCGRDGPR
ncbi:Cytochrome c oxidase subunit 1 [Sphingomonas paucimobilis]|nr:Cytochrome c oxidase subunit 1 [Sphingomonas paucimobilis]